MAGGGDWGFRQNWASFWLERISLIRFPLPSPLISYLNIRLVIIVRDPLPWYHNLFLEVSQGFTHFWFDRGWVKVGVGFDRAWVAFPRVWVIYPIKLFFAHINTAFVYLIYFMVWNPLLPIPKTCNRNPIKNFLFLLTSHFKIKPFFT